MHGLSLVEASGEKLLFVAGAQASHCGGFSSCGAQALGIGVSVVAVGGLSSHGPWA